MRKRRKTQRTPPSRRGPDYRTELVGKPIMVRMILRDGTLRFWARTRNRTAQINSLRLSVRLTKTETQAFFRRLAASLGYTLPGKKPDLLGLVTNDRHSPVGLFFPDGNKPVYLGLNLRMPERKNSSASAAITVEFSKRKALEVCKALAEPLGWELHEWWEDAA